jgi:hypothetical protein
MAAAWQYYEKGAAKGNIECRSRLAELKAAE